MENMKYLIVVQEDTYGIQDAAIIEIAENIAYGRRENILRETAIDMFYGLIDSYALDMDDEYAEIDESDYIEHAEWNIYIK